LAPEATARGSVVTTGVPGVVARSTVVVVYGVSVAQVPVRYDVTSSPVDAWEWRTDAAAAVSVRGTAGTVTVPGGSVAAWPVEAVPSTSSPTADTAVHVRNAPMTIASVGAEAPPTDTTTLGERPPGVAAIGADRVDHLANRYGGESRALIAMIERDPTLGEPLVDGLPYLKAEAVYGARYEMARSVDDLLSRRTRARLLGRDACGEAAPAVAALVAAELGWDDEEQQRQVKAFHALIDEERTAATGAELPDAALDATAGA